MEVMNLAPVPSVPAGYYEMRRQVLPILITDIPHHVGSSENKRRFFQFQPKGSVSKC